VLARIDTLRPVGGAKLDVRKGVACSGSNLTARCPEAVGLEAGSMLGLTRRRKVGIDVLKSGAIGIRALLYGGWSTDGLVSPSVSIAGHTVHGLLDSQQLVLMAFRRCFPLVQLSLAKSAILLDDRSANLLEVILKDKFLPLDPEPASTNGEIAK
jgi:hypothetical protein